MSDLPEPDPIRADRRRARRDRRVPPDAACVLCLTSDPEILIEVDRSLLEADHAMTAAVAPGVTVWLCRNCHAIRTAAQHDHRAVATPGSARAESSGLEDLSRGLRSLGMLLHDLAHVLVVFADWLLAFATGQDTFAPGWRDQPWAARPRPGWAG